VRLSVNDVDVSFMMPQQHAMSLLIMQYHFRLIIDAQYDRTFGCDFCLRIE
jgi:hypothetical protein